MNSISDQVRQSDFSCHSGVYYTVMKNCDSAVVLWAERSIFRGPSFLSGLFGHPSYFHMGTALTDKIIDLNK